MSRTPPAQGWTPVTHKSTSAPKSTPTSTKKSQIQWSSGRFYNVTHLLEQTVTDVSEAMRLPPRRIMDIASKHTVIVDIASFARIEEAIDALSEIAPGAIIRPNKRTKQVMVGCKSQEEAINLATNPPRVNDQPVKAYRPIPRSESMTLVSMVLSAFIGSLTETTRAVVAALQPFGEVVDVSACLWHNGTMTGSFNVILDRGSQKGNIPHSLEVCDTWAQVFGKDAAPWCVYCRREGHVRQECDKRPQTQKQNHLSTTLNRGRPTMSHIPFRCRPSEPFFWQKAARHQKRKESLKAKPTRATSNPTNDLGWRTKTFTTTLILRCR